MPERCIVITIRLSDGRLVVVRGDVVCDTEGAEAFYYEDGNGACDCALADLIRAQVDPAFPDMPCGNALDVVSIVVAPD